MTTVLFIDGPKHDQSFDSDFAIGKDIRFTADEPVGGRYVLDGYRGSLENPDAVVYRWQPS